MSEKELENLMDYIVQDAPMLKYLLSKGIPFVDEHKAYKLKHCEKRSSYNPFACDHGMMDLHVDTWREDQFQMVSVCFYYEQNGDMCKDPDILFRFNKRNWEIDERFRALIKPNMDTTEYPFNSLMEIPLSYQLDSMGFYQETFIDGKAKPKLIGELQRMLNDMAKHCRDWNYNLEAEK